MIISAVGAYCTVICMKREYFKEFVCNIASHVIVQILVLHFPIYLHLLTEAIWWIWNYLYMLKQHKNNIHQAFALLISSVMVFVIAHLYPCKIATLQHSRAQNPMFTLWQLWYLLWCNTPDSFIVLFYVFIWFCATLHLFSVVFDVLLLHSSYFPHFLTFYCWILLSFIWFCATCVGTLSLIRCARVLVLPPHTVCYAPHQIKPRQRFSTGKQRGEDNIPTERDENRPERDGGKQYSSHGRGRKGIRNCKTN